MFFFILFLFIKMESDSVLNQHLRETDKSQHTTDFYKTHARVTVHAKPRHWGPYRSTPGTSLPRVIYSIVTLPEKKQSKEIQ